MVRDLGVTSTNYETLDGVVVKNYVHGIEGGVVIDFTEFPNDFAGEGHGVIKSGSDYKLQPIDGSLDNQLVGVLRSHVTKKSPSGAVMTNGTINSAAAQYPFNRASLTALRTLGVYNQED